MQIAASVISSITNVILNLFVVVIVRRMKFSTRSKASSITFMAMFLATLINSCLIPLMLNASIFGYRPDNYISFLTFIDFSKVTSF